MAVLKQLTGFAANGNESELRIESIIYQKLQELLSLSSSSQLQHRDSAPFHHL